MDKNIRIIYMGTPDFAVEPLKKIIDSGFNVVAVVTVPDKKSGRGQKIQFSPVKKFAIENNIPLFQPENLKDPDWLKQYTNLKPDLGIVVAFRMLPKVVWNLPPLGTFNLHASLLPLYRGAAPINWAIINGDTETGVTTFFLDEKIDTGKIILQKSVVITENESAGTLHDKLMYMGADMVLESVEKIISGQILQENAIAQTELNDTIRMSAPKIFKDDCKIDWSQDSKTIYNKIRGLSPYPAAWCDFEGTTAKILETRLSDITSNQPAGSLIIDNGKMFISTYDNLIEIITIQVAGSRAMSVGDYLRGHHR